jgi:hypothetical protein
LVRLYMSLPLRAVVGRCRYRVRTWLAASPALYFPLYKAARSRRHGLLDATTRITIEGFPRSGNSFAQRAFSMANPEAVVAHHTHAAAQVIASVRRGLPTVVLIREPRAAIRSFLVQRPDLGAAEAAHSYLAFYRPLVALRPGYVLASFEDVTRDMGGVIRKVNEHFRTAFATFAHTPEAVAAVFRQMDEHHAQRYGGVRATHIARPVSERAGQQASVVLPDLPILGRAAALHRELLASKGP